MVREWDHNSCPIMFDQTLSWSDIMSDQVFEFIMHSAIYIYDTYLKQFYIFFLLPYAVTTLVKC